MKLWKEQKRKPTKLFENYNVICSFLADTIIFITALKRNGTQYIILAVAGASIYSIEKGKGICCMKRCLLR